MAHDKKSIDAKFPWIILGTLADPDYEEVEEINGLLTQESAVAEAREVVEDAEGKYSKVRVLRVVHAFDVVVRPRLAVKGKVVEEEIPYSCS